MLSQAIERILRDYPETRSSDKLLTLKYWESKGLYLSEAQQSVFLKLPSTESIRRVRQKIQESGLYPATDKVRNSRRFKSYQMQQIAPTAKPKYVEQTLKAVQVGLDMK